MTALIILAAGNSSRLGQPKQNLIFRGKTLLENAVKTGLASKCRPVIVVLGANADAIQPLIEQRDITILINPGWAEGMSSSLKRAIIEVEKDKAINNVIIMLCDQPFVSAELLDQLIQKQAETHKHIIACTYLDTFGVPALFHKSLFKKLSNLTGNEGAKAIISAHPGQLNTIAFDMGSVDIDTIEDYNRLIAYTTKIS